MGRDARGREPERRRESLRLTEVVAVEVGRRDLGRNLHRKNQQCLAPNKRYRMREGAEDNGNLEVSSPSH